MSNSRESSRAVNVETRKNTKNKREKLVWIGNLFKKMYQSLTFENRKEKN